jgi:hypothetical protein
MRRAKRRRPGSIRIRLIAPQREHCAVPSDPP